LNTEKTPSHIKIDERNHVEIPLLTQLTGLGWEVFDLDIKQAPQATGRISFTEVVMGSILRAQLQIINPWLEADQVEEVVKQLTVNFPSTNLLENNRHIFNLLLESTSVSKNRKTGEQSPLVRFIDFEHSGYRASYYSGYRTVFKRPARGSD
jgi:type I restriction enzyme R subunit